MNHMQGEDKGGAVSGKREQGTGLSVRAASDEQRFMHEERPARKERLLAQTRQGNELYPQSMGGMDGEAWKAYDGGQERNASGRSSRSLLLLATRVRTGEHDRNRRAWVSDIMVLCGAGTSEPL